MTDLIHQIVGLLLQTLRTMCISLFVLLLSIILTHRRPRSRTNMRRHAFVNHPPSAWAVP